MSSRPVPIGTVAVPARASLPTCSDTSADGRLQEPAGRRGGLTAERWLTGLEVCVRLARQGGELVVGEGLEARQQAREPPAFALGRPQRPQPGKEAPSCPKWVSHVCDTLAVWPSRPQR